MSPAGAFFALAVFGAARGILADGSPPLPIAGAVAVVAVCAVLGVTWAVRLAALPLGLRETARKVRIEWAYVDDWLAGQSISLQRPHERALLQHLRDDAIYRYPSPPRMPLADHWLLDLD